MRRATLPLLLLLASCQHCPPLPTIDPVQLRGVRLTTHGHARQPRLAWNGSRFLVAYLRDQGSLGAEIDALEVDLGGAVLARHVGLSWVDYLPAHDNAFLVSDPVWNAVDGQWALAYARGGIAWIWRSSGPFSRIAFGSPIPPAPKLVDLSLAWNPVRRHYAVAFVTLEDPYAGRQNDVYLYFSQADGSPGAPLGGPGAGGPMHTVDCPGNCARSALAVDRQGRYALAYFKYEAGLAHPKLGVVDESMGFGRHGAVRETEVLLASSGSVADAGLRLFYDEPSGDYAVALARRGAMAPGGIWLQTVSRSGTRSQLLTQGGAHDPWFSVTTFLGGTHSYLPCFADGNVRCRVAGENSIGSNDWVTPPAGAAPRGQPHHALAGDQVRVVWVEGGDVYFGPAP